MVFLQSHGQTYRAELFISSLLAAARLVELSFFHFLQGDP